LLDATPVLQQQLIVEERSAGSGDSFPQSRQLLAPPHRRSADEGGSVLAMASGVIGPKACPAAVVDRHVCVVSGRLKHHFDLRLFSFGEVAATPVKTEIGGADPRP
jgi:hypothetical protein